VITKGERSELRSLIRQRFKVLRAEVMQRHAELEAEIEEGITAKYADVDKAWADAEFLIYEATRDANRKANDVMRGLLGDGWKAEKMIVGVVMPDKPTEERHVLRREASVKIHAKIKSALLALDRQEADLLTKLTLGALESDEARGFLGEIPTVSQLVPAVRLLELEAALGEDGKP
jgi:hypothetical protein